MINLLKVQVTALLNTISAYWHMAGVAFIVLVLIIVPDNHQSFGYVFAETVNATGSAATRRRLRQLFFWYVLPDRPADGPVHDHGLRRVGAHGRGDAPGLAIGGGRHVHVGRRVGGLRLHPPRRGDVRRPEHDGAIENLGFLVPWIWAESMGQNWAEILLFICVVAQFFCVTASVTSASRMLFAFSRDGAVPGHRLWRKVGRNRVPQISVIAICVLSAALMIPANWNYLVGYLVGTGIAVIGLYIAFILPVILRFRLGDRFEHGAWSLGKHYKWIDLDRDPLGRVHLLHLPAAALQVERPVGGRVHVGGAELRADPRRRGAAPLRRLVGHSRPHKWFKGPVRMGTEEELERMEEQRLGEFDLPTEAGSRRGDATRGAPRRPSRLSPSSAARNSGSAAVRCMRSKCSVA